MAEGAIRVEPDGGLTIDPQQVQNLDDLEATLLTFADRTQRGASPPRYRLSETSVWRARRAGLSLEEITETLVSYSGGELPAKLQSELELWNRQIERLSLELDQGQLVLRSPNPLVITAVLRHRTLSEFVLAELDATTVAVRDEAYPTLVETFDACRYPVMDRVPTGWKPGAAPPMSAASPEPPVLPRPISRRKSRARRSSRAKPQRSASSRCQAITKLGSPCKNRVRSGARYCRVHEGHVPLTASLDPTALSILSRFAYLQAVEDQDEREELLSVAQLARSRVSVLMWIGLSSWLLYHLLVSAVEWGWGGSPPSWLVAGVSVIVSVVGLGRLVGGMSGLGSFTFVGLNLLSLGMDCLDKEGLIVNLCYVGIPVVIPVWLLSHLGLSWAWVFLYFPVGLFLGQLVYTFLDTTSS